MSYNLSVLNDKEFEELSNDVLKEDLNISFQIFKRGIDGGIDLRYAGNVENEIIAQAKHFSNSKFPDLKNSLKKELPKIKIINPKRYLVITSLPLNPKQVDQIVILLHPYLKNSQDVYGYDRIISIISNSKKIEEKYFKLWITSTNILQRIINNAISGRSSFYEQKIYQKVCLYVPTQNFQAAIKKLNENKFLIITGEPGVGKTTISYLLIYELLAKDYKLIYIDDKIKDAEDLLSHDPEEKQVIFFDDFLGSNLYQIINPKNSEVTLTGFIERIQSLKNKFLILTTRTTILNQAHNKLEKFNRSRLGKLSTYELKIKNYSKLDKAKILYNHIYHSTLPVKFRDVFFENRNYVKVIEHRNYSPRLIEFLTSRKNLVISENDYDNFIFQNLNNPHEIWKSAYENQLENEERFLLMTMLTLGGSNIALYDLENAFENRLEYEIKENGYQRENDIFNISIKNLLDGFIISSTNLQNGDITLGFINPSVGDFLLNYLKDKSQEKFRILNSIIFIEQIWNCFHPNEEGYVVLNEKELSKFLEIFKARFKYLHFSSSNALLSKNLGSLTIYISLYKAKVDENLLLPLLHDLDIYEINSKQTNDFLSFIEFIINNKLESCKEIILRKWDDYIIQLYKISNDYSQFIRIKELLDKYGKSMNLFFENEDYHSLVVDPITSYFELALEENHDFSSYLIEKIIEAEFSGNRNVAESIILDESNDQLFDFLSDIGLYEFNDLFTEQFSVDHGTILEKVLEDHNYNEEEYESGLNSTSNSWQNEYEAIHDLFAR